MPLDYKAQFKFNALARRLIHQLTAEELNAMSMDTLLDKVLEPVISEVGTQQNELTKRYKSLHNAQDDKLAHELKKGFEASDIFALYSCPKAELQELLLALVSQNEQSKAPISHSIFNRSPEPEDENTTAAYWKTDLQDEALQLYSSNNK